jgi:hypothetical protein
MARRVEQETATDRSKVEVFYAKAEGSTQSLQDLMRALTTAIGRPVQIYVPPKLVPNNNSGQPAVSAVATDPTLFPEDGGAPDESAGTDGESSLETPSPVARRSRGEGPKKDRNAGIELVPELDLVQEGGTSLKSFFAEKAPGTDEEKVLVFAYYLNHSAKTDQIGLGHILTCFKHMDERVPLDLRSTVRNFAKRNGKGWITSADMNDLKVPTIGENHVKHEMGKIKSGAGTKGI